MTGNPNDRHSENERRHDSRLRQQARLARKKTRRERRESPGTTEPLPGLAEVNAWLHKRGKQG